MIAFTCIYSRLCLFAGNPYSTGSSAWLLRSHENLYLISVNIAMKPGCCIIVWKCTKEKYTNEKQHTNGEQYTNER